MIVLEVSLQKEDDGGIIDVGPSDNDAFGQIAVHLSDLPCSKYGRMLVHRARWYNHQPLSDGHAAFYVYYRGYTPVLRATRWWWFTRFLLWCSPARKLWVRMVGV